MKDSGKITTVNSKHAVGNNKVPMTMLPRAAKIHGALAMRAGNETYGYYNFRESGVSYIMYLDGIERHLDATVDGEDFARDTLVHHLGHIIAGAGILLDAIEKGNILDDRPPKGPAANIVERENNQRAAKRKNPRKQKITTKGKRR